MRKIVLFFHFFFVIQISLSCTKDDDDVRMDTSFIIEAGDTLDLSDECAYLGPIKVSLFSDSCHSHQSAASYGDYAVFVTDRRSTLYLYNLRKKRIVCKKYMGAIEEKIGKYILYHSNQMTFGRDFYDSSDPFPLLYISQRAREDNRCIMEVYRLTPKWSEKENEYIQLEAELIQMIYFPVMTQDNSLGRINCAIDASNNIMYAYSYSTIESDPNRGKCRISLFNIPDIHEKEVYLNDEDIIDSYPLNYNGINSQGGCIKDDRLFIAQGYQSAGYIYLNVIDLKKKKLLKRIDLLHNGFSWEPEGCFIYNNNIMISTGTWIWEFIFI